MSPGNRCPTCHHVFAIHDRDGKCPRWVGVRGLVSTGTRVCFRKGTRRWPDCDGHVLAYFIESIDEGSGMVLVWDLTAGQQFEAPVSVAESWTKPLSGDARTDAAADLALEIGDRVIVVTMGLGKRRV